MYYTANNAVFDVVPSELLYFSYLIVLKLLLNELPTTSRILASVMNFR